MKITEVTVGVSKQVFQGVGLPELWNKITISSTMDSEVERVETVIDELHEVCNKAHEKYSQSMVDSQVAPVVKKETFADLKKELHVTPK